MGDQHEFIKHSEILDPSRNDISSNSNFDDQVSPRILRPSLKFIKNIKEHSVLFVVVAVMTAMILSVSITCIAMFGTNRNNVEAAMTDHNKITTMIPTKSNTTKISKKSTSTVSTTATTSISTKTTSKIAFAYIHEYLYRI